MTRQAIAKYFGNFNAVWRLVFSRVVAQHFAAASGAREAPRFIIKKITMGSISTDALRLRSWLAGIGMTLIDALEP